MQNPHLWNSEDPYLYQMVFCTGYETITERVGIREIHCEGNVIYVNGKKIKWKGINRHDSDPVTGSVVSQEQMEKDLRLMKQHNFNAVRSSHYPNVPYFTSFSMSMAFSPLPRQTTRAMVRRCSIWKNAEWENVAENWNRRISNNPDFIPATMDRTKLCVTREKTVLVL